MPYIPKQYDSAKAFLKQYTNLGNINDSDDNARLQAYNLYDDFYYNRPETFRVTKRGSTDVEIYLPSTKKIVNSTARYLGVDFNHVINGGSQDAVSTLMGNLFDREEVSRRFVRGKRSYLTRGDLVWYITADDKKAKGDRISINTIHPSTVFRIEDESNPFRVKGYHIVDIVQDPNYPNDKNHLAARRQTYRKEGGRITYEVIIFQLGFWDDRTLKPDELKPIKIIVPKYSLPEQIKQLPIYHMPNDEPDGSSWGLSQVAGIEYIINAINQSVTYEDLTLVLQGLGLYVTTAAPPMDNQSGKTGKYKLHPGNVVQMSQGDTFERVNGVMSVSPWQDHMGFLDRWALDGAGIPDMATGSIDVSVAQSGIALALKMGPIIAENQDKEMGMQSKWDQIGFDLINGWFPAFEGLNGDGAKFKTLFGDAMPVNRDAYIKETIDLWTADLITIDEVRERLEKVGYEKIANIEEKLLEQAAKKAIAATGDVYMAENGESAPPPPEGDPLGNTGQPTNLVDQQGNTIVAQ